MTFDILLQSAYNQCSLYGGSSSWLWINFFVILISLLIISLAYLISRPLPAGTRAKVTGTARSEVLTALLSALIIVAVLALSSVACVATGWLSSSILASQNTNHVPGFPALQPTIPSTSDPFSYAEQYVGNIAFNTGPNLATQLFAGSYMFAWIGGGFAQIWSLVASIIPTAQLQKEAGPVSFSVKFPFGADITIPYTALSDVYVDIFSPMMMVSIGIMLIQYILLIIAQNTAFIILLPVALIMRALSFLGGNLRYAANIIIAIAIALYLVLPLTVVFDSYVFNWIFTICPSGQVPTPGCNPSASYLYQTYQFQPSGAFNPSTTCINILGSCVSVYSNPALYIGFLPLGFANLIGLLGDATARTIQITIFQVSEYMFLVIVMFAINLMITLGFAQGLAKALNGGIEGAAAFWSNL